MKPIVCIYHGNCADGFTAAWVVRRALGEADVEFVPGVYGTEPPDVAGRAAILVDFSYKRPVMERIVDAAISVVVLDHHKTAEDDLRGLRRADVQFDMTRAGCRIAWDYYFPREKPPPVLLHVEDRDLWRFSLPKTREIQANVFSYPYEFPVWDRLMAADPTVLAVEGEAIERKHFKDVKELVEALGRELVIGGHSVRAASLPYTLTSDAGALLAEGREFGACYWDTPRGRTFSLRSAAPPGGGGFDVSEVARLYGGGGHRNAAGFTVSFERAREFEP